MPEPSIEADLTVLFGFKPKSKFMCPNQVIGTLLMCVFIQLVSNVFA